MEREERVIMIVTWLEPVEVMEVESNETNAE